VFAVGFAEASETDAFRYGSLGETAFVVSLEVSEECDPLIEMYEASAIEEHLPYELADRDFEEEYGVMEPLEVLNNTKLRTALEAMQEKYKQEFERYGVRHLRLQESK